MKKLFRTLLLTISLLLSTTTFAQSATNKQQINREQLAKAQAQHIANDLAFNEETRNKFIETYIQCQKEIWALGPCKRLNKSAERSESESEQALKERFERSEKLLSIRQKYYKKYSTFLTQKQIVRIYQLDKQMMQRFTQKRNGRGNGNAKGKQYRR